MQLPRFIAIIVTLLVVLFVIAVLSLFVAQAIQTIASTAGTYSDSFSKMANRLLEPVGDLYAQQEESQLPIRTAMRWPRASPASEARLEKASAGETSPAGTPTPARDKRARRRPWCRPRPTRRRPRRRNRRGLAKLMQRIDMKQITKELTDNAKQIIRDLTNRMFNILKNTVGTIWELVSGVVFVCIFVDLPAGRP